jgi:hypothetical protein
MMEENMIELPRRRTKKGSNTKKMSVSIPEFLVQLIEEEAKIKNKSKSQVITYLIYSGLKAHVGTFRYPTENTIRINYLKRGKIWTIKK